MTLPILSPNQRGELLTRVASRQKGLMNAHPLPPAIGG
jgi:hypothetical protein